MIDRRSVLGSLVAASGAAVAGAWLLAPADRQLFHLPLEPETALWRELIRVRQPLLGEATEFAAEIARLDGAPITLRGFMLALREEPRHQHFTLTANPVGCPGCQQDRPGMRLRVTMRQSAAATGQSLTLSGRLRLVRWGHLPYEL